MKELELISPAALDVANRLEFARQVYLDAEKRLTEDMCRVLDAIYADLAEEGKR